MFWEKEIEYLNREDLDNLILIRIKDVWERCKRSDLYKKKYAGIEGVHNFDDFRRLPFTTKQDLRDSFPYGDLTVNLDDVVRMHSSSGTTGNPTVIFHTKNDLNEWSNLLARSMYMAGVRKSDIFQNIMGYGLFTGGLGFHYGAEKLGTMVIPIATGNSKRQIWFMQQMKTTVVHFLPSYALRLAMVFDEENIDPKRDTNLRIGMIGAEPHSEETRRKIESLYGIKAFNSYGLSEMNGPGVAFECEYQSGMHLWEDNYYMEIVDPESGEVLPDGEWGELVLTTLKREAMPIVRYRTRDLTRIIPGQCKCGRTHRRIDRIKGRSDDMLIINGVNIFPMQIEKTLMQVDGIGTNYVIEVKKDKFLDKINIKAELDSAFLKNNKSSPDMIKCKVMECLKSELGVNPIVDLLDPGSLPDQQGKVNRVVDLRGDVI